MLKTKRLNPFGLVSGGKIKGAAELHKMLKKAKEIEDKRKGFAA
jgi:quinone-modifying oxidoreductase subunit QmoC